MNDPGITIRLAEAHEVIDLRHEVLRAGLPRAMAIFPGDNEADTRHVVAERGGNIIGCATIVRRPWQDQPAWQLRGMAVARDAQGVGIGARILEFIENIVRNSDYALQLWCNARTSAEKFYEKLGWQTVSDVFDVPTAGPHVKMMKQLEST